MTVGRSLWSLSVDSDGGENAVGEAAARGRLEMDHPESNYFGNIAEGNAEELLKQDNYRQYLVNEY